MSQPGNANCEIEQPGEIDPSLNEFWVGSPFKIRTEHNLSAFERNRMFLNTGARNFLDISYVSSTDSDGDGRASLAADVNHDGMPDLIARQAGGGPLLLYENRFPQQRYLKVTLRGRKSNRLGIGARLIARVGERQIVRERYPINTYMSQAPLVVHFGLGTAKQVDELVIQWPSGENQTLQAVPSDRHVVVTEGSDELLYTKPGEVIAP